MPLLAQLIAGIGTRFFAFFVGIFGAQQAVRIASAVAVAGTYVAVAVAFSVVISPWIGSVFSTQYGALLGLLFPPVAGTVVAALVIFWGVVLLQKYFASLLKMVSG